MAWQYHLVDWKQRVDSPDVLIGGARAHLTPDIPTEIGFSCLDLAPPGATTGKTLVATDERHGGFSANAIKFGINPADPVPDSVIAQIGNALGITISLPGRPTAAQIVRSILVDHGKSPADTVTRRWNKARPSSGFRETVPVTRLVQGVPTRMRRAIPTCRIWLGDLLDEWADPLQEFDFDHGSRTIEDNFSYLANNEDLGTAHTPNVINNGNNWTVGSGANDFEGDGAGDLTTTGLNDFSAIDAAFVDGTFLAEFTGGGSNNNGRLLGRSDNVSQTWNANDFYAAELDVSDPDKVRTMKMVSSTLSDISVSGALSLSNGAEFSFSLTCDGDQISMNYETPVSDTPANVHGPTTDTAIDGTTVGGSFWGMLMGSRANDSGRFRRCFFDDGVSVSFPVPLLARRQNTLLRM